jgi:CheY-like chemotaxis protein
MGRPVSLNPTTALIVEDEVFVRIELVFRLTDMGLVVLSASDADEAIAILNIHPEIELLLTDITMPGSMDGIRLAHHVRHRWPSVKIIVLSGLIGPPLSDLPRDSIFVPKPYGPDILASALGHMLNSGGPPSVAPQSTSLGA